MHFTTIFGASRSGSKSSSKAPATPAGTPVKSAKLKAAASRKNPRGVKISQPILVQPTAAERAAVHEIHRQYMMLAIDQYWRGGRGGLQRRPRVVKPKKNKKTKCGLVQSPLRNEHEQDQNQIEYAAAANPVRVEIAQPELSPLEELELQLLGALAATGEMMIDSSF